MKQNVFFKFIYIIYLLDNIYKDKYRVDNKNKRYFLVMDTTVVEEIVNFSKYEGDGFDNVVITTQQRRKPGRRRYFPSNQQNSFIVNAETGEVYPWRVGSHDSLRLFQMVDVTGTCDNNGYELKITEEGFPNRNPNHIYYDSPEQYMKHQRATLAPHFVENFRLRKTNFTVNEEK